MFAKAPDSEKRGFIYRRLQSEKLLLVNMKPYGIGLVIMLAGLVLVASVWVNLLFINPARDIWELFARLDQLFKVATISFILAAAGVAVFLVEFVKHEHRKGEPRQES